MKQQRKNNFLYFGNIAWLYTKYQLLTKSFLFVIIFPIFNMMARWLIGSTGRVSVSSGDFFGFLFSLQGIGLILLSLIVLVLLIGIDINAFIIMSALIKENRIKLRARQLFIAGIKSLKSLCKPSGILIMLYIAIVVPLVGIGISVSVMKNFKIPNFISDVIFNNNMYLTIYSLLIVFLTVITIVFIFFFHYLIIDDKSIKDSLVLSFRLVKKHWRELVNKFFIRLGIVYIGVILLTVFILYFMLFYSQSLEDVLFRRLSAIFISISTAELFGYFGIMVVPLICFKLTDLFYEFNKKEGYDIKLKQNIVAEEIGDDIFKKIKLRTKFSILFLVFIVLVTNFFISLFLSVFFEEIFKLNKNIYIVAHRGGGDLAAENSIKGMEEAAKHGAKWSEIDVQRTKDGYYIINHDSTFARVANNGNKSTDLTLEEIKSLEIKDLFNIDRSSQPVPTLEEYLDAAKGKIGLFIELKGSSADEKMVDDVVKMVKEKGMEKEIAILSLDYRLINYSEKMYPEIDTGYLYFFSIGKTEKLVGDILIMEEQEATSEKIEDIHNEGKKAVVWTVNTDESIEKFVLSDVDGIITDYVVRVKEGIEQRDSRSDIQIIIDSIME